MIAEIRDGLTLWQFSNLAEYPEVLHAISDRNGGVSPAPYTSLNLGASTADAPEHVRENRQRLYRALGVPQEEITRVALVHGARVAIPEDGDIPAEPELREADAIVTALPRRFALLTYADCIPILLYDPVKRVTGAVHAGWRGTVAAVTQRAIETMQKRFGSDPAEIRAGIGPGIGQCCYAVGSEVIEQVQTTFGDAASQLIKQREGQTYLDLLKANEILLRRAGVTPDHIEQAGICTSCTTDRWFSHRAEHGKTGRFVAVIGLK